MGQPAAHCSLGDVQKSDGSLRILHDGTHGVLVNPEIRQRDQVPTPGIGEEQVVQIDLSKRGTTAFGLKADVSKAHRRFKLIREDWGLVACEVVPGEVWLNTVGTFGLASSNCWFGRLISGPSRIVGALLGQEVIWQLLSSDDHKWAANGANALHNLLFALFILGLVGVPLSYEKVSGGFTFEWVGYYLDYKKFQAGISDSRSQWSEKWFVSTLTAEKVPMADGTTALGRLGFAAGPCSVFAPLF